MGYKFAGRKRLPDKSEFGWKILINGLSVNEAEIVRVCLYLTNGDGMITRNVKIIKTF